MEKTIISEGRTTNEAIEKGLKELNVAKSRVDIKVLESDDKRSFFSILAPRVVKVQLTLKEKEEPKKAEIKRKREVEYTEEEQKTAKNNLENFIKDFVTKLPENTTYSIECTHTGVNVKIENSNLGFLIGHRGETLYAMQNIMATIASKGLERKIRVILDIEGYKAKREKTLEELAEKIAKTVVRTRKSIKLEPMQAYERKIIHTKLQSNPRVETNSIGEEPYRRIVVSYKRKEI